MDNSADSTTDASDTLYRATDYACANTMDKIFLLSARDVSTTEYGFAAYNVFMGDENGTISSTRIRVTTDYAQAIGIPNQDSAYWWWLRSPYGEFIECTRGIFKDGAVDYGNFVGSPIGGVVPALCVQLQ